MQVYARHIRIGYWDCNSLTQHGGSSGISKIGRRRDPSYRIITGQGPCLMKSVPKRFNNYSLFHKRGNAHSSLKCSKEYYKGQIR